MVAVSQKQRSTKIVKPNQGKGAKNHLPKYVQTTSLSWTFPAGKKTALLIYFVQPTIQGKPPTLYVCKMQLLTSTYTVQYIELQRGSADTERLADVAKTGSTCYHFLHCFVTRIYEAFLQRPMSPVQWHLSNAKDESHALCTHTSYTFAGDQPGHKFTVGGQKSIYTARGVTPGYIAHIL